MHQPRPCELLNPRIPCNAFLYGNQSGNWCPAIRDEHFPPAFTALRCVLSLALKSATDVTVSMLDSYSQRTYEYCGGRVRGPSWPE